MDTKEKHEKHHLPNQEAEDVLANGKRKHNHNTVKTNKLWLWLGVLVLIFILLYWLWTIGLFEDMSGIINGN